MKDMHMVPQVGRGGARRKVYCPLAWVQAYSHAYSNRRRPRRLRTFSPVCRWKSSPRKAHATLVGMEGTLLPYREDACCVAKANAFWVFTPRPAKQKHFLRVTILTLGMKWGAQHTTSAFRFVVLRAIACWELCAPSEGPSGKCSLTHS